MRKKIITFLTGTAVLISIAAAFSIGYAGDQNNSPKAVVKKLNAVLLKSMKGGKKLGFEGRYALFKPVIQDIFALDMMTRISVGKHWKNMSEKQRKKIIKLYQRYSAATYASRFDKYNGQYFEVLTDRKAARSFVNVHSRMVKKNKEVVAFLYKLRKVRRKWLIVDIQIKGVSQLANTRAQFTTVLNRDGYSGLIKKLEQTIDDLSDS